MEAEGQNGRCGSLAGKDAQLFHLHAKSTYLAFCEAGYSALCSWNIYTYTYIYLFILIEKGLLATAAISTTSICFASLPDTQLLFQYIHYNSLFEFFVFVKLTIRWKSSSVCDRENRQTPILSHVACCLGNHLISSVTHFSPAPDNNIPARFYIIKESANSAALQGIRKDLLPFPFRILFFRES